MPFMEITEAAAGKLCLSLEEEGKLATHALRVKVVGGGCSGLSYQLGFDDQVGETDTEIEAHGVRVVVDERSALFLVGTQLDFADSLMEYGFKFRNPNARSTCGCGQSFAA